jgi:hypothetical protein
MRRWKRTPEPVRRWAVWIATLAGVVWLAAVAYFLDGQADGPEFAA